jgi:CHAD domain-containing protein
MRLGMLGAVAALEQRALDPTRSAELVILGTVASAYATFDRRRRAARDADLDELHRLRIAFKKFRYAVELGAPLLRVPPKPEKDTMKRFQDELGALQDSVVVLELFDRRATTRKHASELRVEQARLAAHVRELLLAQTASPTPEFSDYLA